MNLVQESAKIIEQSGIPFQALPDGLDLPTYKMTVQFSDQQVKNFMDGGFIQAAVTVLHPSLPTEGLTTHIESDGPDAHIAFQIAFSNWLFYEFPLVRQYCLKQSTSQLVKVLEISTPVSTGSKAIMDWTCFLSKTMDPNDEQSFGANDFDRSFFNLFLDSIPSVLVDQHGVALFHVELTNSNEFGMTAKVNVNGKAWEKGANLLLEKLNRTPMVQKEHTLSQRFLCSSDQSVQRFQPKFGHGKSSLGLWRKIWKSA